MTAPSPGPREAPASRDYMLYRRADRPDHLVKRDFAAGKLNQKWFGDGTEIQTAEGKLYLLVTWNQAGQRRGLDRNGSSD